MRKIILGIVASVAAAGCTASHASIPSEGAPLLIQPTETPFVRIVAGDVSGLVPGSWSAVPLDASPRQGFVASPNPEAWGEGASTAGIAATWVDATEVGLPRDAYYLVARGPLMAELTSSPGCRAQSRVIVSDNAPRYLDGVWSSPGDYIAKAEGICRTDGGPRVRWSYFVAAPGYGPAMELGIPASGLYVATAITRDSPNASERLARLLSNVRFGEAGLGDFIRATRAPVV
ncbi:MAG TPA: hypothetical protein VIB62_10530 [Actinomycetota bacterium]